MNLNKKLYADYSGIEGGLNILKSGAETSLFNQFATGTIAEYMSNGTDGSSFQMSKMNSKGQLIIQNGNDNSDFSDISCARLALNSTKDGFLIPRMTQAQRDALATVSHIYMVNEGTGYTTATIVVVGGGGSGFSATPIISLGNITGANIINPGVGYLSQPSISFTGDGSGAGANIFINLVEGLQIYNLDTHKLNFYDGSGWQQATTTSA